MHKITIPIQRRGFPPKAQRIVWSVLGAVVLVFLWMEAWKGGWHLMTWAVISLFIGVEFMRPLRAMIAPPRLGGHSLSGVDRVRVEILSEGRAVWSDEDGAPIDLEPEEAWRCWLTILAHHGFPAAATEPGCFRLRLSHAEALEPMPRRYPEYAPGSRTDCAQSSPPRSRGPFWCLVAFFGALLAGSIIVGLVDDPGFAALGGGPLLLITGSILLIIWLKERRDVWTVAWCAQEGYWRLTAFSGTAVVWRPGPHPVPRKWLPKAALRWPDPDSSEGSQPSALALFMDDQAKAVWDAERHAPSPFQNDLKQDSL